MDYGKFITMTEDGIVERVEIQEEKNRILFTNKLDTTIYKTAMVEDQGLIERLYQENVSFSGEEIQQKSPLFNVFVSWIFPMLIFVAIGQFVSKKMMNRAGGKDAMMFGLGKSNAKVYVKSSQGIKFKDVAGEEEAKENLKKL